MPAKKIITPGTVFGHLVVLRESEQRQHRKVSWWCRCDCGAEKAIAGESLFSGNTKSCGCGQSAVRAAQLRKHGHAARKVRSKAYRAWAAMTRRTSNPRNARYSSYGGRGITVCARWKGNFENFLSDMGEPPSRYHSLDRIDVDGSYAPENCRWATAKEQSQNKRATHWVVWQGERMCLEEACRKSGLASKMVHHRLSRGWPIGRALATPRQALSTQPASREAPTEAGR